jgi:L-lactate dehydrogenase complex protein LldG
MVSEKQKEMNSREKILERVKLNQPEQIKEQTVVIKSTAPADVVEKFKSVLISVGGAVIEVRNLEEIKKNIESLFANASQIISSIPGLNTENQFNAGEDPHSLERIQVAILEGEFGVAENGAVWLTEKSMIDRALPFICENLVLIIKKENILATLHEAYDRIDQSEYNYGTFISGPSKTADIEQSLVLGAHGAKTMTVFCVD